MKMKPQIALAITLVIFVLGIVITSAAGLYSTQTTKTPSKIEVDGYTDQNDPADIRGSYTFGDISRLYNIPLDDLTSAFGLDGGAAAVKVSTLESYFPETEIEVGPPAVRLFVAYYLDLPYDQSTETWLPKTASDLLIGRGTLTPDRLAYVETHTFEG